MTWGSGGSTAGREALMERQGRETDERRRAASEDVPEDHAGPGEPALVARALAADPAALGALFDLVTPEVRRYLVGFRAGVGAQDLDDAVQETYLRLLRGLQRLQPGRRLVPYALGIARHVALDLGRRPRHAGGDAVEAAPGCTSTSDRVARQERRALVLDALAALDPELRSVLLMRVVNDLPMKEVEEALDCSAPTARARVREAIHRLAIELRRRGLAPGEVCQ